MLVTQSSPPEAGEGEKHKHQLQEGSHQHPSAGAPPISLYVLLLEGTGTGHSMQVVQEAPQAFISQLVPGETERQKNNVANQNSAFGTSCPERCGFPHPWKYSKPSWTGF